MIVHDYSAIKRGMDRIAGKTPSGRYFTSEGVERESTSQEKFDEWAHSREGRAYWQVIAENMRHAARLMETNIRKVVWSAPERLCDWSRPPVTLDQDWSPAYCEQIPLRRAHTLDPVTANCIACGASYEWQCDHPTDDCVPDGKSHPRQPTRFDP